MRRFDDFMESWLSEQVRRIGGSLPSERLSLKQLLSLPVPAVKTVSGGLHYFRREDVERAVRRLDDARYHDYAVFPLVFSLREELGRGVYAIQGGEAVASVFAALLGLNSINRTSDGVYYTYKPLVYEFMREYPSLCVVTF